MRAVCGDSSGRRCGGVSPPTRVVGHSALALRHRRRGLRPLGIRTLAAASAAREYGGARDARAPATSIFLGTTRMMRCGTRYVVIAAERLREDDAGIADVAGPGTCAHPVPPPPPSPAPPPHPAPP